MNRSLSVIVIIFILNLFLISNVNAQQINISYTAATADNAPKIYQFDQYKLNITKGFVDVQNSGATFSGYRAIDLSNAGALAAILYDSPENRVKIYSLSGEKLHDLSDIAFGNDDPSLRPYILPDGSAVIRSDIANFAFYDATGQFRQTVSNNTSSQEGEAISGLVKDQKGQVILLYNPKIYNGDHPGSRISRATGNSAKTVLFNSSSRYIKKLQMADNGRFIGVVTARENTEDQVIVMDLFGNQITKITAREVIRDISFSNDTEYITLMSSGRMSVYNILRQERVGSSSIRGASLLYAQYVPEDNLLVGLAGTYNEQTGLITQAEIKAVDFEKRKIASEELNDTLSLSQYIKLSLDRKGGTNYLLTGLNKHLELDINF